METGRKENLSRQVAVSIEKMILKKNLTSGDALPTESQIVEELCVSKSSVREAIKMLEALGVVEVRRGLCTVVSTKTERGYLNILLSHFFLNGGSTKDIQDFRFIIEAAYTVYAIQQSTDEDIELIEKKLDIFRRKAQNNTVQAEDDVAFHSQILEATHNYFLINLGNALNELFLDSIATAIRNDPAVPLRDHEAIFQAIITHNPSAAVEAIAASSKRWAASFNLEDMLR